MLYILSTCYINMSFHVHGDYIVGTLYNISVNCEYTYMITHYIDTFTLWLGILCLLYTNMRLYYPTTSLYL